MPSFLQTIKFKKNIIPKLKLQIKSYHTHFGAFGSTAGDIA